MNPQQQFINLFIGIAHPSGGWNFVLCMQGIFFGHLCSML
jgi:hypothetical protein